MVGKTLFISFADLRAEVPLLLFVRVYIVFRFR